MTNGFTASPWPDRFWEKVDKTEHCWLWTAGTDSSGYGVIRYKNKNWKAHRLSLLLFGSGFLEGLDVCHSCDNPTCVNPDHLFSADTSTNMLDMVKKGRHGAGSKTISYEEFLTLNPQFNKSDQCLRKAHNFSDKNTRIKYIKRENRFARICRQCQKDSQSKNIIKSKVNSFVRGVENRTVVRDGIVKKIENLGGTCVYCGGPFECLDHVIPKSRGGIISVDNIVPSCYSCNQLKGAR